MELEAKLVAKKVEDFEQIIKWTKKHCYRQKAVPF